MYPPNKLMIIFILAFIICFTPSKTLSQEYKNHHHDDDHDNLLYCQSWRFAVEANIAVNWTSIPDRCYEYISDYMIGDQYLSDTEVIAQNGLEFAKTVDVAEDGKDCWIFDVDETLLSHLTYYKKHGFGAKAQNTEAFKEWATQAKVPALRASWSLYKKLQQLGFTIIILTGRSEPYRNITEVNLLYAGYINWKRLIMRDSSNLVNLAIDYKSGKRKELEDEGYRIHGSVGDQWSDLMGYPIAQRSFKLPNPTYYVP